MSFVPLLRTRRIAIAAVLKESGRAATTGADKHRTRSMLVVAQVALALLLVASSGLLARSFARLRDVKPGFDRDERHDGARDAAASRSMRRPRRRSTSSNELLTRARAIPACATPRTRRGFRSPPTPTTAPSPSRTSRRAEHRSAGAQRQQRVEQLVLDDAHSDPDRPHDRDTGSARARRSRRS